MHLEVSMDIEKRRITLGYGKNRRHFLTRIDLFQEYLQVLEKDAQLEPLKPVFINLLEEIVHVRIKDPIGFKNINYQLLDKDRFKIV